MAALHTEYLSEDLDDAGNPRSFALRCPPGFNFGYDVVDRLGAQSPERRALRWCNDDGELREYTFGEVSRFSDQAASTGRLCETLCRLIATRHCTGLASR